jgi:ABC-type lipoprotein export system ATPase subunit
VRNKDIGFVFQFYHLLPELDVLENVVLPALLGSFAGKKRALAYARALLEEVGLSGRLQHRPNMLSGGEQQRAAIARALVNRPQLLLCDEPTGNLDSDNGKNILRLLKQLNKETGMAVLLVTHDKEVASFAERTIFLRDGRIDY